MKFVTKILITFNHASLFAQMYGKGLAIYYKGSYIIAGAIAKIDCADVEAGGRKACDTLRDPRAICIFFECVGYGYAVVKVLSGGTGGVT